MKSLEYKLIKRTVRDQISYFRNAAMDLKDAQRMTSLDDPVDSSYYEGMTHAIAYYVRFLADLCNIMGIPVPKQED